MNIKTKLTILLPTILFTTVCFSSHALAASGSVPQANMKMSIVAGTAFVDFSAANALTPYVGA